MDDDVAAIHQNPIAMRQSLNPRCRLARRLEGFQDMIRHSANMDVGAAAGDDHNVGEGRLTLQIDRNDILGLGVFQSGQDSLHQRTGVRLNRTIHRGRRRNNRLTGECGYQCFDPLKEPVEAGYL
jgi:hypothetical protein